MPISSVGGSNRWRSIRENRLFLFFAGAAKVLIVLYFGIFAVLAFAQTNLIFAGAGNRHMNDLQVVPTFGGRIVDRTGTGDARVLGLFEPALDAQGKPVAYVASRPTMIYFYGNGSSVSDSVDIVDRFRRDGVNVFIPEYDGFGMNSGPASEKACFRTADLAYAYLTQELHIDPSHIVIAGWSLGSAVALDLASRSKSAGLVVISPFTNMAEQSSNKYPLYPAWLIRLVLRYPFANDDKIGLVKCPIMDIHSKADEVVPFFMSAKLMLRAKSTVTRIQLDRGHHGDFFNVGGHVYRQMLDFVYRSTKTSATPVKRTVVLQ